MIFKKNLKNLAQTASRKAPILLWLVSPLLLGAILLGIVTHIMYFGGPREGLVASGESAMITQALRFNGAPAGESGQAVVAISVTDDDLSTLEHAPHRQLHDAHLKEYATILERVAAQDPEWVVVSWLNFAHPTSPEYLKPLTDVIDRLNLKTKVTLAVNLYASGTIPPDFIRNYNIVEARDCYHEINIQCTVSSEWTWMPQQIMNRFFKIRPNFDVSMNLPHFLPNILLNLPTPASITQFSFMDMQPPALSAIPSHAIVFIGNNSTQSVTFRNNKDALQRTYIASSTSRRSLIKDGIPWHIFWAAMTSMFLDHKTIAVAPTWFILAACTLVAILIAFGIYRLGGLALATFFVLALLSPLANILSVRFLNLYIPMMPILIIGFVSFSATVFISVTLSSYRKYRLVASENLADETADIKQNFLQLISHNLNTPIAQLRGLLDLLALQKLPDQNINRAQLLIDYLRLTVRAVLDANLPKTAEPPLKKSSLAALLEELMDNESHFFSRMAVELQIDKSPEDSATNPWDRLWPLDQDIFSNCITYSALLISNISRNAMIGIRFNTRDSSPGHEPSLLVDISLIKNGTDNLQPDLDVMREAFWRYLANLQRQHLINIRSTSFGLTLEFVNP